ncbi:hypothetical protein O181_069498 [Austropuccinia psidii MF-1]|uniref:Uncharacterized protein n=1 Tax=Austropuccinia psidii MF-1 TaxID=1389203 RepID=A0A9Q3F2A5_9BASI|nr:hypothetical protein [Austropuccinia psidii MF-1]
MTRNCLHQVKTIITHEKGTPQFPVCSFRHQQQANQLHCPLKVLMLVRINKQTHLNPVVTTQRGYDGRIRKLPRIKRICIPKNVYPAPKGWGPPIEIQALFSMTSRKYARIWKIRNMIMKKHTRAQAFKRFAQYLNDNHVLGTLNLNGQNLQQWWRTYKRKFVDTTWFLNSTGAGTTDGSHSTIQEEIEDCCPCYKRMMGIFGDKQNVVGHNVFNSLSKSKEGNGDSDESHRDPVGLDTSMESNSNTSDSESWAHRPSVEDLHNKVEDMPRESASKAIDESAPLREDDGDREDILDRASTPRFEEIENPKSGGISITQDGRSPKKSCKKKNAAPQRNLPEKFVSNKPQSVMSILERRLDLQKNKQLEHMKSQMLYQHAQDEKTGELKLLEIRENKAIKEMELNYQRDIQVENNKYRYAQEERAAELHRAQLQFQQEELDLKKAVAKWKNQVKD